MKSFLTKTFFIAATALLAASSGCAKPSDFVESQIASNSQVKSLDATLNAAYKKAMQAAPDQQVLRTEQRRWIAEVRNKCTDVSCLLAQYQSRNQQLDALGRKAAPTAGGANVLPAACPVKEADLVANWTRVKGGDFEEFELSKEDGEQAFASWLHHRPEMMGTWVFKDCALSVSDPNNPALSFDYRITAFTNAVLHLQELEDGAKSTYKRRIK